MRKFKKTFLELFLWMVCGSLALELRWTRTDAEEYRETSRILERKLLTHSHSTLEEKQDDGTNLPLLDSIAHATPPPAVKDVVTSPDNSARTTANTPTNREQANSSFGIY